MSLRKVRAKDHWRLSTAYIVQIRNMSCIPEKKNSHQDILSFLELRLAIKHNQIAVHVKDYPWQFLPFVLSSSFMVQLAYSLNIKQKTQD